MCVCMFCKLACMFVYTCILSVVCSTIFSTSVCKGFNENIHLQLQLSLRGEVKHQVRVVGQRSTGNHLVNTLPQVQAGRGSYNTIPLALVWNVPTHCPKADLKDCIDDVSPQRSEGQGQTG